MRNDLPLAPTPVAVVGIGNMGLAMALRLRDAGQAVQVHDSAAARHALAAAGGALPYASAAQAAAGCAVLIVAVVDAAQTEAVLFGQGGQGGAAATLAPGATVLLCPTIGPADVERLATRLAGLGLACLDAPMSGGPARARDGSMSLMVAGADTAWQALQPLLRHLAARLFRISGRPGDGARTKLVNNLLAAVNLAGAAEAIALAQRLGAGRRADAGGDRAIQRPQLDRRRPPGAGAGGRFFAARPHHPAGQGFGAGDGHGRPGGGATGAGPAGGRAVPGRAGRRLCSRG